MINEKVLKVPADDPGTATFVNLNNMTNQIKVWTKSAGTKDVWVKYADISLALRTVDFRRRSAVARKRKRKLKLRLN